MSITLEERKREVAKKSLVASTKSFKSKTMPLDVNKRDLFRFKNALSDMTYSEVINWLESTLWHENLQELNHFLEVCKDNGISGLTACKWTNGILESEAYKINDPSLRQHILQERDRAASFKLPPIFETFTAEESHLAKFKIRKVLPEAKELVLDLPVVEFKTRMKLNVIKMTVPTTAELTRLAWIAFACLGESNDVSKMEATRNFRAALLDNVRAFSTTPSLRLCDLTKEQMDKLCIVQL